MGKKARKKTAEEELAKNSLTIKSDISQLQQILKSIKILQKDYIILWGI